MNLSINLFILYRVSNEISGDFESIFGISSVITASCSNLSTNLVDVIFLQNSSSKLELSKGLKFFISEF